MSSTRMTPTGKVVPSHQNLTPNEKAIIDRIRIPLLRELFTTVWRVKLRLQFTGWLQYLLPGVLTLAACLLAGLALLLRFPPAAIAFASAGALLLLITISDLITVKVRVRPREHRPRRRDDMGLFDLMRSRRSCRSFQTRTMEPADRDELLGYVRLHTDEPRIGPSPVRFEYVSAPLTVWPTVNASEFLVAIAPKKYDRLAVIDVGRCLQKIVMDATRMGLGTCWIGPGADHNSIMYHLGERFDAERDHIICVCAVGYPSRFIPIFIRVFNAQMHRRLPLTSLFFSDAKLTDPLDVTAVPFSRFERTFEVCEWAPSSYNGQTTRCAAVTTGSGGGQNRKIVRFDFYAFIESRFYAPVAVGIWCANWEIGCASLGIPGRFAVLSEEERGIESEDHSEPPRYDVSWVPENAGSRE